MSSFSRKLLYYLRRFGRGWRRQRMRWGLVRHLPVNVAAYRGFANTGSIYLTGRLLRGAAIISEWGDGPWRNLVNNLRRFNSREVNQAEIEVEFEGRTFHLTTDAEGYFRIDQPLEPPLGKVQDHSPFWHTAFIRVNKVPDEPLTLTASADVLIPLRACLGIISDIDDTVLKTDVTGLLKLRTIYLTLLKNAGSRLAFRQVSAFYRSLQAGPDAVHNNPFFYVSNSPWNLYDLLADFLDLNELPRGPILLRDFGLPYEDRPANYPGHKHAITRRIIQTYPELPFVLIGDSGEKDTDIYLSIAREFPGRISAIYIRDVLSPQRARRVSKLIEKEARVPCLLIRHYDEAARHAADLRLCSLPVFEQLAARGSGLPTFKLPVRRQQPIDNDYSDRDHQY